MSLVRPLDRYVFSEFWKIFLATAFGFPLLVIIFDVTDHLDKYLAKNLPPKDIALSYFYGLPDSMFLILPAAVLFATVFSIGAFTRHSEITAAKASGVSFYRFIAPIFLGAVIASAAGLVLGELAPHATKRKLQLLESQTVSSTSERYNFAYSADAGRVYKVQTLHVQRESIDGMTIERRGRGPSYPSYIVASNQAIYNPQRGWKLLGGTMHVLSDSLSNVTYVFDSLRDRRFSERPKDLMLTPKAPADMDYRELGQFIQAMERSGANVKTLRVERMLKIVIPITSIIILLFGASLATSTQRGGAAYGVGLSLATTVVFIFLIQLTKGLGQNGIVPPELAAWLPSLLFGVIGAVLFARVRT
ncbi:MAG: LptF/LptG family permease [Gemmatimonadaceae bacterium]|nr:LptF/LptG family permease [Gemmatimonadaceae bacterium]MDQ3242756.1 LptF/LptG family permease [Gemmatimonadota bacterium]